MDIQCWFANLFIVFARIKDDKNITAFIVPVDLNNGITLGEEEEKLGIRASSTRQVFFNETKVPIEDIGFIYNCVFKQRSAAIRSIEATREVYPDSKTYLVSDGGLDYSFLEDENLKFSMQEDTVSPIIKINESNFLDPKNQAITKKRNGSNDKKIERGIRIL